MELKLRKKCAVVYSFRERVIQPGAQTTLRTGTQAVSGILVIFHDGVRVELFP